MPKQARKPPPVPPPLERSIQQNVVTLIATKWPWLRVLRLNSGKVPTRRGWVQLCPVGTPDVLVILPGGRVLWIEMKRDGTSKRDNDTRKAQIEWAEHATGELQHTVIVCETAEQALAAVRSKLYAS